MKGGGAGDKAGRGGGKLQQPLRLESQRFRLLSIVVGCFVICLVFLLSSRPDATAFDTVSPRASLEGARRRPAAVKTLRTSSTAGVGGDFHVDIRPQQQQGGSLRQSVEQSAGDKTATEWVRDTVIVEERSDAEASEAAAEPEEAAESNPDDQPAPGTRSRGNEPGAEEKKVRDDATVVTTAAAQPAAETTATAPDRPEGKPRAAGGGQSKLQEQPARQPQEERHEPARRGNGTAKATPDQTLSTGQLGVFFLKKRGIHVEKGS